LVVVFVVVVVVVLGDGDGDGDELAEAQHASALPLDAGSLAPGSLPPASSPSPSQSPVGWPRELALAGVTAQGSWLLSAQRT